jgi:hypothetical protein
MGERMERTPRASGRRSAAVAGAALVALALSGRPARRPAAGPVGATAGDGASDPVAVARAFNTAWNAHDVEGVVARFAPGATVWQTDTLIASDPSDALPAVPVARDAYGAGRRSLADAEAAADSGGWARWARGEILWAAGGRRIRTWLAWFFAAGHRVEATGYQARGDTVTWRFRAFADPYQGTPGVAPTEGTARLALDAGRVASFTFATERPAVARRDRQLAAAGVRAAPHRGAGAGAPAAPSAAPAPDALGSRLPLALVGAGALAGLVAKRRRAPGPSAPAPARPGGAVE